MDNNSNFETYLFIGQKKIIISVNTELDNKIYENEISLDNETKHIDFNKLDFFLDKNIFKIEKLIKNFVKKIFIIIELDDFFPIKISIKKKK